MDLSCIILSGDLELYVLGMLPEDEAQKITQLIGIFPEIRQEVERISETLNMVSSSAELAPRNSVKEKIFEELRRESANPGATSLDVKQEPQQQAKLVEMKKSSGLLMAAAVIGILVFASLLVFLFSQNQKNQTEVARLEKNIQQLNNNLEEQKQQNLAFNQLLQLSQDENYSGIELKAVPGKPDSKARIYWNRQTAEVFVVDISLPATPSDKQYQLWAIVNGTPVSAGVMENRKMLAQKMADFRSADAFAITLEKKGGSASPTLEEMYVLGKPS